MNLLGKNTGDAAQQQKALFGLLDVLSLLWRKEYTFAEAVALKPQLVEALVAFEKHFPMTEMCIKTHNVLHLADKLIAVGPLFATSMFPYERMYSTLKAWVKNRCMREATVIRYFLKFQQCQLFKATGWSMSDGLQVFDIDATDAKRVAQMQASVYARWVDE